MSAYQKLGTSVLRLVHVMSTGWNITVRSTIFYVMHIRRLVNHYLRASIIVLQVLLWYRNPNIPLLYSENVHTLRPYRKTHMLKNKRSKIAPASSD